MGKYFVWLITMGIALIVILSWGKKQKEKRIALLNETSQKNGWPDVSHEAVELLHTLRDFRLFRTGTRTNITNVLMINEQDRLLFLEHGSMTNSITYGYPVLLRKLNNKQHPVFNIGLKRNNWLNKIPKHHTVIQSEQLGMLNSRHDVESRTSDASHVLNLLTPHVISMFDSISVEHNHPELEVREQYLLIYRPRIKKESSATIARFVQQAQAISQKAQLI